MQVKCEVFSRFGNSVDFYSGEPLGGVGTSTVGADLCVRLSSPERSLFCGRTRRSAPTRITSTRQIQPSDAVTLVFVGTLGLSVRCIKVERVMMRQVTRCRDARSERPSPVPQRIQIPMHQHAELARCVPRRKNFFRHLVDWKSCSTFALATQKNGVSEVSEPYEW